MGGYDRSDEYGGPPPTRWGTVGFAIVVAAIALFWAWVSYAQAADHRLDLPNLRLTPGVARTDLTLAEICTIKWSRDARHVTAAMKRQVFAEYGLSGNDDPRCVATSPTRRCEVDHLISRELGGADDIRNLWPEPYGTRPWNATVKDRLENRLHKEICAGHISLKRAQKEIATDWRVPYRRYFGEPPN